MVPILHPPNSKSVCALYWLMVERYSGVDGVHEHLSRATIKPPKCSGRPISECIASARASGSKALLDGGFGRDVEEGIRERSQPWNPPSWD